MKRRRKPKPPRADYKGVYKAKRLAEDVTSKPPDKREYAARVEADRAAFLARGGEVTKVEAAEPRPYVTIQRFAG